MKLIFLEHSVCLLLSSLFIVETLAVIPQDFNKVNLIQTKDELDYLIRSRNVAVIYYYKKDIARIRHFFKEFDKSAEYLAVYGVQAGIVDCSGGDGSISSKCQENQIEHSIYTYRDGEELLVLELETMFDVNSIMSNVLQLVLLHEVPIIQTKKDRDELIEKNKGKSDIIFSYQKAIGTYEHRIFMEVAFAYQDKYSFAVTTEKDAVDGFREVENVSPTSLAAIWVLHCKEVLHEDQHCIDVRYKGKMDLPSLAKFLRSLSLPQYIKMKTESDDLLYTKDNLDIVFLIYDEKTKDMIMEVVGMYKYDFHGIVGMVLIDQLKMTPAMNGRIGHVKAPGIGILRSSEEDPLFMTTEWSEQSIAEFLAETLFNKKSEFQGDVSGPAFDTEVVNMENESQMKHNLPTIEEVEDQDDLVAQSVFKLTKEPMTLDKVEALTDETYSKTIKNTNLLMIMFYLPFDVKSMAFLRAYGDASVVLGDDEKGTLARINCYDWTDVCGKQNISRYPTVRLYKDGEYIEDYRGVLGSEAVISTINLIKVGSPIKLNSEEKVSDFIQGKLPINLNIMTNTSVLGVFDTSHKSELLAFNTVVNQYRKSIVFGITDDNIAKSIVKVKAPAIILIRHDDQYKKDDGLTTDFTVDNISDFINNNKIPTLPELTETSFPEFYQRGKPLVVLFLDETVSLYAKETMAAISKSGQFKQFIFCWMDIRSNRGVGEKLLKEYTQTNEVHVPAVSVVNNKKGDVYNYPGEDYTELTLSNWLSEVTTKSMEPSKILTAGNWKQSGRSYDFLAMIDYEDKHGESPELSRSGDLADEHETSDDARSEDSDIEDMEARAELIGLGNSRLYHTAKERKLEENTGKTDKITHKRDEL